MQMWSWAPDMHRAAVDGRIKTYYPHACNTCLFLHVCGRALKPGFHPPCEPPMEPPLGPTEPAGLDAPTALADMVAGGFAPGGVLAQADAHFQPRPGQTRMAMAVARTMAAGGRLVVEAGTGVGKTFSYLVPALLSGERVLLSTATKVLQDQLFARDLPGLARTLGLPGRMGWLKGRASYLCLHRMELARQDALAKEPGVARALASVQDWSRHTLAGDLAELTGLDERSPVLPLVTSTRENCLGTPCPRFRDCHVHRARREALAADMAVINHHLFFADGALRESGLAQLLPRVRVVVCDEAHQITETGVQFLGTQLSTGQLLDFGRDLLMAGLRHACGLADWSGLAAGLELAARDLRLVAAALPAGTRLHWGHETPQGVSSAPQGQGVSDRERAPQGAPDPEPAPQGVPAQAWQSALQRVASAGAQACSALAPVSEMAPDLLRLHQRGCELLDALARFCGPAHPDAVRWVEVAAQLRLIESPLDIAQVMRERLLAPPAGGGGGGGGEARGGPGQGLDFHLGDLGRGRATELVHAAGGAAGCGNFARRQSVRLRRAGRLVRAAPFARAGEPGAQPGAGAMGGQGRRAVGRAHAGADHHAQGPAGHWRGAPAAVCRRPGRAAAGAGAGPVAPAAADGALSRRRRQWPAGLHLGRVGHVPRGFRRARGGFATGGRRQTAVSFSGRSIGSGAHAAHRPGRGPVVQGLCAARGRRGAQAGRRAPDPA